MLARGSPRLLVLSLLAVAVLAAAPPPTPDVGIPQDPVATEPLRPVAVAAVPALEITNFAGGAGDVSDLALEFITTDRRTAAPVAPPIAAMRREGLESVLTMRSATVAVRLSRDRHPNATLDVVLDLGLQRSLPLRS